MGVSELSERFLIPQATECKSSKIIKYIGIAVSVVACLIFILGVFTKKTIWDMFHSLRMHLMACWIGLVSRHMGPSGHLLKVSSVDGKECTTPLDTGLHWQSL